MVLVLTKPTPRPCSQDRPWRPRPWQPRPRLGPWLTRPRLRLSNNELECTRDQDLGLEDNKSADNWDVTYSLSITVSNCGDGTMFEMWFKVVFKFFVYFRKNANNSFLKNYSKALLWSPLRQADNCKNWNRPNMCF